MILIPWPQFDRKNGNKQSINNIAYRNRYKYMYKKNMQLLLINPFPNDKFSTLPKPKEFADDDFEFDKMAESSLKG